MTRYVSIHITLPPSFTHAHCSCTHCECAAFYGEKDKAKEILSHTLQYTACKRVCKHMHLSGIKIFKLLTALRKIDELFCVLFYFLFFYCDLDHINLLGKRVYGRDNHLWASSKDFYGSLKLQICRYFQVCQY